MQRLNVYIEQAITKAQTKDFSAAAAAYQQFEADWFEVEDRVRKTSRPAYRQIEAAMGDVKFAFFTQPPNQSQVVAALQQLKATNQKFIAGEFNQSETATVTTNTGKVTISSLIERLSRAEVALNSNDVTMAAAELQGFQTDWLEVKGVVATKSKDAYVAIENNMAKG